MTRTVLYTGDIFRHQPRGGITRYFLELIARLQRPHEVVIGLHQSAEVGALPAGTKSGARLPSFRGVHRVAGLLDPWFERRLGRAGAILHPTYYRDPARLPSGAPLVVTVFDMTHERLPQLFGATISERDPARYKAALVARADRVVCISESTRRDVVERLGTAESKLRVTPLAGRDWQSIASRPVEGVAMPFLLWVGPRAGYKNFATTLDAWARCRAAAGTTLLCAGGPPLSATEREQAERLGVAGRLMRRPLDDGELRWAYEHTEALLYTSLWEGFGIPVVEALALGCPAVGSDRAPIHEVGGDAVTYAEPGDPDAMAAAIDRCLAAPRDEATRAARRAQAARFSWERCAQQHDAIYAELD